MSEHYSQGTIQPVEYILANALGFCEGNVVKYITRYKHKGTPLDDLRKAREYIDFLIREIEHPAVKSSTSAPCETCAACGDPLPMAAACLTDAVTHERYCSDRCANKEPNQPSDALGKAEQSLDGFDCLEHIVVHLKHERQRRYENQDADLSLRCDHEELLLRVSELEELVHANEGGIEVLGERTEGIGDCALASEQDHLRQRIEELEGS